MEQTKIKITIEFESGKSLSLEVSPYETIESIQTRIMESEGIGIASQQLGTDFGDLKGAFKNCYLPYETVEGLGLTDGAKIYLCIRSGGHSITIKNGEETFPLDSDVKDSIYHVKELIAGRIGVTPEKIVIIFAGKTLTDGRRLMDYCVQKDSIVHLLVKKRGPLPKDENTKEKTSKDE